MKPSRRGTIVSWVLQLVAAAILFQTLFFKFTGAEESVYIFSTLHMEPWGRIGSGVAELIACVLLLIPGTVTLGALLALGVISGALVSHLTKLGIVVKDDGGLLFFLAVAVFVCSAAILVIRRREIPFLGRNFGPPPGRGTSHRHTGSKPQIGSCGIPGGSARSGTGVILAHGPTTAAETGSAVDPATGTVGGADGGMSRGAAKRVLILGGGFGGVYAALQLEKKLARRGDVHVTLVNRENFFLFTPMLHEVAASDLDLTNIVSPVRKLLRNVDFFQGDVEAIDLPSKKVTLVHGSDSHPHEVAYDYLIVALGSITNFFNLPGLAERALTMKSLGDAIHLRNGLIAQLEEADTECATPIREPLLTFVVAGGGFAGVETIAGLNDFVRDALTFYPHIAEEAVRVVLVHPGQTILPELGDELGGYAQKKLAERGVEIRTGTRVTRASDNGVELSDGTFIPTRTLVWTAGTSPHPLLAELPCEKDRGRLLVNEFLEVAGYPGVWALGDCAVVPDKRTGKPHPPTAQHALREGKVVALNVAAAIDGGRKRAFDFSALGQLAAIGKRTGVASILGFKFSGFTAWWLWRTIYLSKLPRFEKKVRVAFDWTLDIFFSKDLVQFLTERARTLSRDELPAMIPQPGVARAAVPQAAIFEETGRQR